MIRPFTQTVLFALCGLLAAASCPAQDPGPAPSQSPSPASAGASSQQQGPSSTLPLDPKRPKKVWTNDDVGSLKDPVSVVGNSKNLGNGGTASKADGQYIANARKELQKLQSQLEDTDKQLADLKDFSQGKAPATSGGYQINKGYNRVPVDQQITSLEDKKKQLQDKIDALFDEARKKGVEPGQLR